MNDLLSALQSVGQTASGVVSAFNPPAQTTVVQAPAPSPVAATTDDGKLFGIPWKVLLAAAAGLAVLSFFWIVKGHK